MRWLKNIFKREENVQYDSELKKVKRILTGNLIQNAASPFAMLCGGEVMILISDHCEWLDIPDNLSPIQPTQMLAMLLSLQGKSQPPVAILVFHDGLQDHGTSFVKVEGSPSRVYYNDPFGDKSLLNKCQNKMGVRSRKELDGNFSISYQEFETMIAAIVIAFPLP